MGRTSTSKIYGMVWGAKGTLLGAAALSWIPIVGPIVGGLVGGMVGYMAGSKVGNAIFSGLKTVGSVARSVSQLLGMVLSRLEMLLVVELKVLAGLFLVGFNNDRAYR